MLSEMELRKVVGYIGVQGGYLGDFSYNTHADFYPIYCNLDIDPNQYEGTTRVRFMKILNAQNPINQAKILMGVLKKYPIEKFRENELEMKKELKGDILMMIQNLIHGTKTTNQIEQGKLEITTESIERAIIDAETLMEKNGPISAIDRVHTILHGYMLELCKKYGVEISTKNPSITELFKELRTHPKMKVKENEGEVKKITNSLANMIDCMNQIRNTKSIAHPNENLLGDDEAMLAINASRTILNYLNAKFK